MDELPNGLAGTEPANGFPPKADCVGVAETLEPNGLGWAGCTFPPKIFQGLLFSPEFFLIYSYNQLLQSTNYNQVHSSRFERENLFLPIITHVVLEAI